MEGIILAIICSLTLVTFRLKKQRVFVRSEKRDHN